MPDDLIEREIILSEWFPPDDDVATAVARLCILREDFYLAGLGLAEESIPILDGNGNLWRKLYFFRKLSVTLMESRGALMMLNKNKEFLRAIEAENLRDEVLRFEKELNTPELEQLRHRLGGHVDHNQVGAALKRLDPSLKGRIQVGPIQRETHFTFATNLVKLMLPEEMLMALQGSPRLLAAFDRVISAYYELKKLT
jgi:hypothetical protein